MSPDLPLNCIYSLCGEKLSETQTRYTGGITDLCLPHRELAEFLLWMIPKVQITRQQPQIIVPKLEAR